MAKGKVNPKQLEDKQRTQLLDLLWTSIAGLETREEVKNFFKDLLSESEAIMLARRILVARKVLEGNDYEKIIRELKVGRGTVANVQRWLASGFGGYENALKKFEKTLEKRESQRRRAKEIDERKNVPVMSFTWLRRRYPLYFLLLNLILDRKKKNKQ